MLKKVTSFTHHTTAEGERVSYTYSTIGEDGSLINSNERATMLVLDKDILNHINEINKMLTERIVD